MDVALAIFNVGAGLGVLAAGGALAYLAWQTTPLIRESRALAADLRRLTRATEQELRPILAHTRELAGNAEVLSEDVAVKLDRLTAWHRPGLLAIGDAAHAMSPVGGIGINLAIQDAVAAANILAGPLAKGEDVDPLLHKVEERRLLPTRIIQRGQKLAQDNVIGRLLQPGEPLRKAPLAVRLLDRFPLLRRIPGRLIGLGIRRERVRSPELRPSRP